MRSMYLKILVLLVVFSFIVSCNTEEEFNFKEQSVELFNNKNDAIVIGDDDIYLHYYIVYTDENISEETKRQIRNRYFDKSKYPNYYVRFNTIYTAPNNNAEYWFVKFDVPVILSPEGVLGIELDGDLEADKPDTFVWTQKFS